MKRIAWLAIVLARLGAAPAIAQEIADARFTTPTDSYDHGILGDAIEYAGLMIRLTDGRQFHIDLSSGFRVFEDIAPRLWDVTGDGKPEVVVIETDPPQGAQLAIYGIRDKTVEKIAQTPHIGRSHRWLAPLGAADLDGDGRMEIAYIDRPHLAKTLRIWRYEHGALVPVIDRSGLTNHRIGDPYISGGIRTCAAAPEIIAANANWTRLIASTLEDSHIETRDIGPFTGPDSFAAALACD